MYRFLLRPKWIGFHLLVIAGVVTMINLGFWQLRRLDERKTFNTEVTSRTERPPVTLDQLLVELGGGDPGTVQWREVEVTGEYLTGEDIQVVNRSQGGVAGSNFVTPLRLDDGRLVLINRGFVPLAEQPPPAPAGTVRIEGRIRPSQSRRFGQLSDPSEGDLTEVQRVDIPRLAPQLPGDVVPVYIDRVASDPADGEPPFPVPLPELTEGPHLSYAIQWFIFSTAAVVGWVLAVRRSIRTRRSAAASSASSERTPPDSPAPSDGEPATAQS